MTALGIAAWAPGGCRNQERPAPLPDRDRQALVNVRDVRVLLADGVPECRVRVTGPFVIQARDGRTLLRAEDADWTTLRGAHDRTVTFGDRVFGPDVFELVPQRSGSLELSRPDGPTGSSARRYGGRLRLTADDRGMIRVVNLIDVETYVACVLPGELFPNFEREAFRAQAVAARTYVLYQMARRAREPYDVSATEASQVYPGIGTGRAARRAREATEFTRGIVATWTSPEGERLFCTFYSACCGGRTQDVANCRTDVPRIPPLAGGVPCNCPRIATSYRWNPVRMDKDEFTRRLASWDPKVNALGRSESIQVVDRTPWGRPTAFRLTGSNGRQYDVRAEDLRLAVGSRIIRSTDFQPRNGPDYFEFADGKGFGHGMGLCQWGMQEMALTGHGAAAILKHYYPTMHLTRAY